MSTITKKIGRYTYSLRPFPFDDHAALIARLACTVGPGADVFAAIVSGNWGGMGTTVQALGRAVLESLNADILTDLCAHLRVHDKPNKKKGAWSELKIAHVRARVWSGFDGETLEGYEAISWLLEASFEGFQKAVTDGVQRLLEQRKNAEVTEESTDGLSESDESELGEQQDEN